MLVNAVDLDAEPGVLTAALASGLFAVTLTDAGGACTGWAEPWRARLRALRRHPHPDVRDAALFLATAQE